MLSCQQFEFDMSAVWPKIDLKQQFKQENVSLFNDLWLYHHCQYDWVIFVMADYDISGNPPKLSISGMIGDLHIYHHCLIYATHDSHPKCRGNPCSAS